jgi:hypothetical protein
MPLYGGEVTMQASQIKAVLDDAARLAAVAKQQPRNVRAMQRALAALKTSVERFGESLPGAPESGSDGGSPSEPPSPRPGSVGPPAEASASDRPARAADVDRSRRMLGGTHRATEPLAPEERSTFQRVRALSERGLADLRSRVAAQLRIVSSAVASGDASAVARDAVKLREILQGAGRP